MKNLTEVFKEMSPNKKRQLGKNYSNVKILKIEFTQLAKLEHLSQLDELYLISRQAKKYTDPGMAS